jgi:antitoxin CptB
MKTPPENDKDLLSHTVTTSELKTKLTWQCRRGMLELDVILVPFLEQYFEQLNQSEQGVFVTLLNEADPDLYSWFMGYAKPEQQDYVELIALIKAKLGINRTTR